MSGVVKQKKLYLVPVGFALIGGLIYLILHNHNIAVLNPQGPIAAREKTLILTALALSLLVVIPVYIMTVFIAVKYRASNQKAKYQPDWDHSRLIEGIWWLIPSMLIAILSVITWNSSHQLDPYKAIASKKPPLNIQVVGLDWKWLFIYPDQKVASLNYFKLPTGYPINLSITADAPMNSFWLPNLGGQIYAMPGMDTQLHLLASKAGNYPGSSANISGSGFAGMDFTAQAVTPAAFKSWLKSAAHQKLELTLPLYNQLAKPSTYDQTATYQLADNRLFLDVINKYILPPNEQVASGGHLYGRAMEAMH